MAGHASRSHALLSASGSSRWLKCPPSARLEDKVAGTTSIHAAEGTLAHEYSEILLMERKGDISSDVANKEIRKIKNNELYKEEMDEYVLNYVNIVWEQYQYDANENDFTSEMDIEVRVEFQEYVPEGFATPDVRYMSGNTIHVWDLKYGRGVEVSAKENTQLMIYALGAIADYDLYGETSHVHLHIIQPRLSNYSDYKISVKRLLSWAENTLKPKAQMAYKGEGRKRTGDHCRFCKVMATCPAMRRTAVEAARHNFADPDTLTIDELASIQKMKPLLVQWLGAVSTHLTNKLKEGDEVPGYKIVEGKSNRKWKDEKTVAELLEENEFTENQYTTSSILGVAKIQKLVGKDLFNSHFSDQVEKPRGAPTLVPESDKRPAYGIAQAKSDFADELE